MASVDKQKILAFLKDRQMHRNLVVGSIYAGLVTRIADGQFDEEEKD